MKNQEIIFDLTEDLRDSHEDVYYLMRSYVRLLADTKNRAGARKDCRFELAVRIGNTIRILYKLKNLKEGTEGTDKVDAVCSQLVELLK